MATLRPKTVLYRRKREQKTNYHKRLHMLAGKNIRLVVRRTNQRIIVQAIQFTPQGDLVLAATDSSALKKEGWNYSQKNIPAAYLTGLLFAQKALSKGCREAVLDSGFSQPKKGGKISALLHGVLDGGMKVPIGESLSPSADRLSGKHIHDYAAHLKNSPHYEKKFGKYLKEKALPEKINAEFMRIKEKLLPKKK